MYPCCCKKPFLNVEKKEDLRIDKILFDALKRYGVTIEEFELYLKQPRNGGYWYGGDWDNEDHKGKLNFGTCMRIEDALHDIWFAILDMVDGFMFHDNHSSTEFLLQCVKEHEEEYNKAIALKEAAVQSAGDVKLYPAGIVRESSPLARKKGNKLDIITLYTSIDDAIKNGGENEKVVAVRVSAPHTGKVDEKFPILYAKIDKMNQHMLRKSYAAYLKMHYTRQEIASMNLYHYENYGMNHYASDITSKFVA